MTEEQREILVRQLLASISQLEATLAVLGYRLDDGMGSGLPEPCTHPPEKRKDESVMGGPERWTCQACGFSYDAFKES